MTSETQNGGDLPVQGNNADYGEGSIQILEGLEAVRKRPGMYIGGTDERALHHLAAELVELAVVAHRDDERTILCLEHA